MKGNNMGKVNAMFQDRLEEAYDRGHADKYYGRLPSPNMWLDALGKVVVTREHMTKEEVDQYYEGYNNCTVEKDWE